jgi:hypothetical protein
MIRTILIPNYGLKNLEVLTKSGRHLHSRICYSFDISKNFKDLNQAEKMEAIKTIHEQNLKSNRPAPKYLTSNFIEYLSQSQSFIRLQKNFE